MKRVIVASILAFVLLFAFLKIKGSSLGSRAGRYPAKVSMEHS